MVEQDKINDGKKTAKAALYNTIANVIVMLFALCFIPITTRVLSTSDLGIATNFFSVRNICLNIFTLATYMAVNRGMLEFKNEKKEFLSSILIFNLIFIFVFVFVFQKSFNNIECWQNFHSGSRFWYNVHIDVFWF